MNYKVKLHDIKAFVFDYDGVMSDGMIYTSGEDIIMRNGNVKDGYAIQYALKHGYKIAVLSGGTGESIKTRMKMLGVTDVILGAKQKLGAYEEYLQCNHLEKNNVLFMGDDIPDYDIMLNSGVATCPKDAAEEIKQVADYISDKKGGEGCVRDVIEQVLKLQGQWFNENAKEW
ncbi:MAG: HAD hydrolase family protein [Bacteroidales bacterium]|nr:HAD hydrolase family protein [Bacteroidales bacterium]